MAGKDVFISYKAEDFDEANWVRSTLENNGISCWMAPSSIPGGSSYASEITSAIRGCKFFVLVLSEKAQHSKWVPKEVDQAINEGKTILPFMLENCSLKDDFNFYLTNVQRYAAYESKVKAMEKMIREIKAILANDTVSHPADPADAGNTAVPQKLKVRVKTDRMCVAALIISVISLLTLGILLITGPAAMICAIIGMGNVKTKRCGSAPFAIAALIMGIISTMIGFSGWFTMTGFIIAAILAVIAVCLFIVQAKKK